MFRMLDQLRRVRELLMALSAGSIRFHFFRQLTPRISTVHFVTGDAGDALARLASAKAFRASHPLILVCGKTGRAVCPEAGRKTEVAHLVARAAPAGRIREDSSQGHRDHHHSSLPVCARVAPEDAAHGNGHTPSRSDRNPVWLGLLRRRAERPVLHMPAISSNRRKSALGVPACRSVTGATRNAQFGDLRIPRLLVQSRLGWALTLWQKTQFKFHSATCCL